MKHILFKVLLLLTLSMGVICCNSPQTGIRSLSSPRHGKAFAFSIDNPTGEACGMSEPLPLSKRYVTIAPGETLTLMDADGPGCIHSIWFGTIWENSVLRMYFDNDEEPAVEAPLAAFFAFPFPYETADEDGDFPVVNSAPVLVAPCRGYNCFWPMPFRKHCRITLTSGEKSKCWCYYNIAGVYGHVARNERKFHAKYAEAVPVHDGLMTVADIKGSGHYVGMSLGVAQHEPIQCFCEGKVQFRIDGEACPSVGSSGLEDYFGGSYSWGNVRKPRGIGKYNSFSSLYMGFRYFPGGEDPKFALYRFHVEDPIPFERSLQVTIQSMDLAGEHTMDGIFKVRTAVPRHDDYFAAVYWYAD